MRYTKATLAALTCAFVLIPAGVATAGSGPAAQPSAQGRQSQDTAPAPEGNPLSARARTSEVCADAYQIGDATRLLRNGTQIATLRQFYSPQCQENYSYLWVWQSYRDQVDSYHVGLGVHSYDQDMVVGGRSWTHTHEQEFWSEGTPTVRECTSAVGAVRTPGSPLADQAVTGKRC